MTTFEEKVNAYRENKRLIEELEAMNDAVKAEIIDMMHAAILRPFGAYGILRGCTHDIFLYSVLFLVFLSVV